MTSVQELMKARIQETNEAPHLWTDLCLGIKIQSLRGVALVLLSLASLYYHRRSIMAGTRSGLKAGRKAAPDLWFRAMLLFR